MIPREPAEGTEVEALLRLVNGYQVSQAIHVAATLGIADLLRDGPRSADDLAEATQTHPPALYRLLRALASVGVVRETQSREFALTPLGAGLRSDAAQPVGPWAIFIGQTYHWHTFGQLLHSVRTGETAVQHVHGMGGWEYRAQHPEESAVFDRAMTAVSRGVAGAVMAAYDFARFSCVVDVGGGQGALLAALLARHPALRGVLFDQPHVVAASAEVLHAAGVAERCRVVGGSFFEAVPGGGDAYVLKAILHDWADEEAAAILRRCREVMEPRGRVLAIERVVGRPNEDASTAFSDLTMLVGPGGRERTREEFTTLFSTAGLRLVDVVPTTTVWKVIEAVPV